MADIPGSITRFVEALESSRWDELADCYAPDAVFDGSVPNWHFQWEGAAKAVDQLKEWWGSGRDPKLVELHVAPTSDGAVVDFELRWTCPGDENHAPHLEGCRQAHIFRLRDGVIAEQRVYCSGEWNEEELRKIDAEAPKVGQRTPAGGAG